MLSLPFLALLAVAICSLASGSGAQSTLSPLDIDGLLSGAPNSTANRDACTAAALGRINYWRSLVNVPALAANDTLGSRAQVRSELVTQGTLQFDTQDPLVENPDNDWDDLGFSVTSPSKAYTCDVIIDNWIQGYPFYPYTSATPYQNISAMDPTTKTAVLYYAQLVWKSTTQVGCGITSTPSNVYMYCYFEPAGAWPPNDGAYLANVPSTAPGALPPGTPGSSAPGSAPSPTSGAAHGALMAWHSILCMAAAALGMVVLTV